MQGISARATELDRGDPLASFRDRFTLAEGLLYLDGNSLGRLPKETIRRIREVVEHEWASELVLGWDHWLDTGLRIGDSLAPLIGANPGEVAVCDQTSINLYKLASAAMDATGRPNIVTDAGNFPSDRYVLASVAERSGGELILAPEDGTVSDLAPLINDTTALVSLSHVSYRSGTLADGAAITQLAHDGGAMMLWDLAHSAGSVPVHLSAWDADMAVGCTYKYLNAGPGAPGFLYVRRDLHDTLTQPITGWFGHRDQFGFTASWQPAPDIRRFLVGTPPIVSMVGVEVGVAISAEAGIDEIRRKSIELTSLFIEGVAPLAEHGVEIVTPMEGARRGSHVTLRHADGVQITAALRSAGVIPDFRAPDLIRFGFAPLYTSYQEVARAVGILTELIETGSYRSFDERRGRVT